MNIYVEIIGYCATALTAIASLPQVIKAIRTKNTEGVSLMMFIIFLIAYLLWFTYGLFLPNYPMIIGNSFGSVLYIIMISLKIHNIRTGKESLRQPKETKEEEKSE